ncbi:ABC transporter permease [Pedobacter sandarakinus]|uniref:ABC transporter permease n=1 Tax=Pedobacter sandarakinus TaxID=353156 RepID=UPI0022450729|nr:ABC transporter permease [Pedobacter sandarakinus]MCX2574806.1 ABC transporter permease [Pedobacter sandarakinus]
MFKLNLKIALRNLWKNKSYAFISIAGLALALTIFILAMLYANYQRSYDAWNKDYEQIYRVNYTSNDAEDVALSPGNLATISKQNIPTVEAATRIIDYWNGDMLVKTKSKNLYVKDVLFVDSNFFKVFQYPAVYGDVKQSLNKPQSIILSKEYSELLFGENINPVGEIISMDNRDGFLIEAVVDVARYPSHFKFNVIRRFNKSASTEYYSNNYYTYVKFIKNTDLAQAAKNLNAVRKETLMVELSKQTAEEQNGFREFISNNQLYIQPVKDIHLTTTNVEYEFANNGVGKYMYITLVVAFLVLIIAAINFTNLSVTMVTKRAKETSVRKVLGAHKLQLAIQFILETALQCLFSFVLALILVELSLPSFNTLLGTSIVLERFSDYGQILVQISIALVSITLIVGAYPALLISNIVPAVVLKGNFNTSNRGYWVRNALIVMQFTIAVVFISGIWIINSQLNYMQQKDLGYQPQQVVAINMMQNMGEQHFHKIKNALKDISGVHSISRADHIPGEDMGGNSYGANGKSFPSNFISVDVGYFEAMGMKILDGRDYNAANPLDTTKSIILTETAAKTFGIDNPVGKTLRFRGTDVNIVGLVKDFNHYSPEKSYQSIVFQYIKGNPLRYLIVKLDPKQAETALNKIEQEWTKLEPEFPIKYTLLDKSFKNMLTNQSQLRKLIGMLSVVTISLALTGLFAIAAFTTQRRNKEINIRKVLGASIFDILKLLNKGFAVLVLIANLIAWPIAYLILDQWLKEFAFRIDMPIMPYVLSGAITLILTIFIVSLQSLKAASSNPVEALKYE